MIRMGASLPLTVTAVALLLRLNGHAAKAQEAPALRCDSEGELLANLQWMRDACSQAGESFAEVDALVPSSVTTRGCGEVVRRVAEDCDGLFLRSPVWFAGRKAALDAAVASAAAIPDDVDEVYHISDPNLLTINTCGAVLDDGFALFPSIRTGQSRVTIDVGPSHGSVRLEFETLTLDGKGNDNLRLYSDEDENDELLLIRHGDLPPAGPIDISGSALHMLLVSDGASRHTSFRVTIGCECEASSCQNGGTCAESPTDGLEAGAGYGYGGGHRRLQGAECEVEAFSDAITAMCCDANDCINGLPTRCSTSCAAVLAPFVTECSAALGEANTALVQALQICEARHGYRCICLDGWVGDTCDTLLPVSSIVGRYTNWNDMTPELASNVAESSTAVIHHLPALPWRSKSPAGPDLSGARIITPDEPVLVIRNDGSTDSHNVQFPGIYVSNGHIPPMYQKLRPDGGVWWRPAFFMNGGRWQLNGVATDNRVYEYAHAPAMVDYPDQPPADSSTWVAGGLALRKPFPTAYWTTQRELLGGS